ncbi:MAG: NUDIX domain-containing protein [Calditrichaeota bacterium]|nr:NUDIX domain-containing protein [Calditrichota bacterium]
MSFVVSKFVDCHVFVRKKNTFHFLLLKRAADLRYPNTWQQVQGKVEPGETAWQAALRELKEETGLSPVQFWNVDFLNRFYYPQTDETYQFPVFAAEVRNKTVRLSHEHSDYKWIDYPNCKELVIWESQKQALDIIYQDICLERHAEKLNFLKIDLSNV